MNRQTYNTQLRATEMLLSEGPKTMLQVSIQTGILRANICRYISRLRKDNRIYLTRTGICPISKHAAGFYSTDKPDN